MSTTLHPESYSGEHRIYPKPTDNRPGPTVAVPTRRRVDHVDLLRGLVMALRWLNMYGDPHPRIDDGTPAQLVISFFNVTKYPPSLLFLLMTLGPGLVALAIFRRAKGLLANVFITFGRVPFLFYVTHLYLVHAIALAVGRAQGFPGSAMRTIHFQLPET